VRRYFPAAAWPRGLKLISALGTLILLAGGFFAYRAAPAVAGFTHAFGVGVAFVFPAILLVSLLFVVTGYAIGGNDLYVRRLLFSTRIPLDGLSRLWHEPAACKGSLRAFGNGGLYSFTGLFWSKALGRHRLFATDLTCSVVLVMPRRTVVITPAEPQVFIDYVHRSFPAAHAEPAEHGR
jgi:hypothetical protein